MANYTTKTIISNLTGVLVASIQDEWLNWADAEIEEETGLSFFEAVSETLKEDGTGNDFIILSKYPIIEITKIVCDGVEIDPDEFAIYNDTGMIKVKEGLNIDEIGLDEVFAKGTQNIEITGKFGYASVPKIVEELATLIVIRIMQDNGIEINKEVTEERIGDFSVKYKENGSNLIHTIEELFSTLTSNLEGEAI